MICVESPEARFMDVIHTAITDTRTEVAIDAEFLAVCEPGSIVVTSVVPSRLVEVAAEVIDGRVCVYVDRAPFGLAVTLTLFGIRKGHDYRFPRYTEGQMRSNDAFWKQAHGGT